MKPVLCKRLFAISTESFDGGGRSDSGLVKVLIAEFDPSLSTPRLDHIIKSRRKDPDLTKLKVEDGACLESKLVRSEDKILRAMEKVGLITWGLLISQITAKSGVVLAQISGYSGDIKPHEDLLEAMDEQLSELEYEYELLSSWKFNGVQYEVGKVPNVK